MIEGLIDVVATFILATVCWNLAHQSSLRSGHYGKIIATGYSVIAVALIAEAFFHWAGRDWIIFTALIKMMFSVTLGFASARAEHLYISHMVHDSKQKG